MQPTHNQHSHTTLATLAFQMFLQINCIRGGIITLVVTFKCKCNCKCKHLLDIRVVIMQPPHNQHSHTEVDHFGFSPLCLFKCFFKSLPLEEVLSHWLHLLDIRMVIMQPSNQLHQRKYFHIGYICWTSEWWLWTLIINTHIFRGWPWHPLGNLWVLWVLIYTLLA